MWYDRQYRMQFGCARTRRYSAYQKEAIGLAHSEPASRLLLTVSEVAAELQIARGKAYELVRSGTLPSVKLGRSVRVPRKALLDWIDQKTSAS